MDLSYPRCGRQAFEAIAGRWIVGPVCYSLVYGGRIRQEVKAPGASNIGYRVSSIWYITCISSKPSIIYTRSYVYMVNPFARSYMHGII